MKIPIVFGWLHFHQNEQWLKATNPYLVCHWYRAKWMSSFCSTYSVRLFCLCKSEDFTGHSEF